MCLGDASAVACGHTGIDKNRVPLIPTDQLRKPIFECTLIIDYQKCPGNFVPSILGNTEMYGLIYLLPYEPY